MKLTITCPAFSLNGGIRVILDMAHELSKYHEVQILCPQTTCDWYPIKLKVIQNADLRDQDVLIISSPHHIHLKDLKIKARMFSYVQMMEHLFQPTNLQFKSRAMRFYRELPVITISNWGIEEILKMNKRVHYIGNGVNFEQFPIYNKKKKEKIVLLESPIPINPTKDKFQLALKVARRLQERGYKIKGYGTMPLNEFEYYQCPDLKTLNKLYREATILLKATVYDFRSTAPLEAGTKGCVTVRGIVKGDDDLFNNVNCLRVGYNEEELFNAALKVLEDDELRNRLADNMFTHLKTYTWEYWGKKFNEIICG
jgi:glycosyltransferase involved in cell wall biosynthesis